MQKELDEALCRDFPALFADRRAKPHETAMCWGFPGNGWEPIIRQLAEKLEPLAKRYDFRAFQVKEKFGGLRFYLTSYPVECADEIKEALHTAYAEAGRTCETCGKPGEAAGSRWIKTLCDSCRAEREAARIWED